MVTAPLTDANAFHLRKPVPQLAKKFAERFQKKLLDKGKYQNVLDELREKDFTKTEVKVDFPAAKDGMSYPAFELAFDCFFQNAKEGIWGILPALGLECVALDEESFAERMAEVVRVEFTSRKRLHAVQSILSAMWFEAAELERTEMQLTFHTPTELATLHKRQKRLLLPKVATKLEIKNREAYGRSEELEYMERILQGRFSKNILLVGASGTGKTALVREVAYRRRKAKAKHVIWETTAARLIKELTRDTGWQDNLSHLVSELTERGDFLFIRNLAELFQVGKYEGNSVSMADYLRSSISRGELHIITECTPEERAQIEVASPNYLAFFQTIELQEPTTELESIIQQKISDIAGRNRVKFEDGAIEEVIRLHRRFMPYSGMPGKPIRFLESVLLAQKILEKKDSKKSQGRKLSEAKSRTEKSGTKGKTPTATISRQTVLSHFCNDSGMPQFMVDPAMPMDVAAVRAEFNRNVFGQEAAVNAVADLLAAVKTALTRTGKPIASFLFVGPTGVGKTELARVLANFTFGDRERMVRFDMSEYSDAWSVMRLTGQQYQSDGLLTAAVRREPFCVLLFDEIEKAHPSFFDLLLQILGEGRLSDSRGQLVNFCSAIIVMTSNIGASTLQQHRIGWKKELNADDVTAHFVREVEKNFKPELFNRIDSFVAFEPLSAETVRYVVEREIQLFKSREGIRFRHIDMEFSEEALDYLATAGYDPRYGARYLQRTIREKLIVPLSYQLNQFDHDDRLSVRVLLENGEIAVQATSDPMAFDLLMERWDRLTLAEETSNLRRKMVMLCEGPLFTRLQSELDLLESEKKRLKEKFWENVAKGGQYTHLLSARESSDLLRQRIENLEIEIALASMEQGDFKTDFADRLDAWKEELLDLKVQVHGLLFAQERTCHVGIYGKNPEALLELYLAIFEHKKFFVKSAHSVWYRENYLAPTSPMEPSEEDGEENQPVRMTPFLKRSISIGLLKDEELEPAKAGDILYGFELTLTGNAVHLYLSPENGLQQWEGKEKNSMLRYLLKFSEQPFFTPANIHRQGFYQKQKTRRTVKHAELVDIAQGFQAQLKPNQRANYLLERLDEQFEANLNRLFL